MTLLIFKVIVDITYGQGPEEFRRRDGTVFVLLD